MKRAALLAAVVLVGGCRACLQDPLDAKGRAYPCDPDAGEDPIDGGNRPDGGAPQCFASWRCGLERVCHQRGIEQPYLCAGDDRWCEGGWTCGIEGTCIAPVDDGFRFDAGEGPVTVASISPRVLTHLPDVCSVAADEAVGPGFHGSAVSFVVDGGFTAVARARSGPPGRPDIGNYISYRVDGDLPTSDVRAMGTGINATSGMPMVLTAQGMGYMYLEFRLDGGGYPPRAPYQVPPGWETVRQEQLRAVSDGVPYSVAFGDGGWLTVLQYPPSQFVFPEPGSPLAGFFGKLEGVVQVPLLAPDGGLFDDGGIGLDAGRRVIDVTQVAEPDFAAGLKHTALVANIDERIYLGERWVTVVDGGMSGMPRFVAEFRGFAFSADAGGLVHVLSPDGLPVWNPLQVAAVQGTSFASLAYVAGSGYQLGDAGYLPRRVRGQGKLLAIELQRGAEPEAWLLLVQMFFDMSVPGQQRGDVFPIGSQLLPPCRACPDGYALVDFASLFDGERMQPAMVAHCRRASTNENLTIGLRGATASSGCSAEVVDEGPGTLRDQLLPSTSLVGHGGWVGAHGQLWIGDSVIDARSLFLDGVPAAMARGGTDIAAFDRGTFYFLDPRYGFIGVSGGADLEAQVVAPVQGRDDWVVTGGLFIGRQSLGGFSSTGGGEAVAGRGATVDLRLVGEPFFSGAGRTNDGGVVVVVTANDAVFSSDVTEIYFDAGARPGTLDFRIAPLNRVAIRSLAVLDVVPDGGLQPYTHGYVLARAELIELTADTVEHWRARPVHAPPGNLVEVWSDGTYGRLGLDDGTVYSLPALKPLGPPVGSRVGDYYQFRGQPWAVADDGVWRLEAARGGPGIWRRAPAADGGAEVTYRGAKLFEVSGDLYLVSPHGVVLRYR